MQRLTQTWDLDQFWAMLAHAPQRALLLDYDGTLAPFRADRDAAVPYPDVRLILDKMLAAQHTRVVIISGRRTEEVVQLLGLQHRLEVWGSHGWERRLPDGSQHIAALDPAWQDTLAAAARWLEAHALSASSEYKPASIAVHLRDRSDADQVRAQVTGAWSQIAADTDVAIHPFDGGLELRAPGRHKGVAVDTILAELGPEAMVAYLGDDLTDEDAFVALKGRGPAMLVRHELRATAADYWLTPPDELLWFLQQWQHVCAVQI